MAITSGFLNSRQCLVTATAASGTEKSITTSASDSPTTPSGTPSSTNAGKQAGILAQGRMIGRFEGGDDLIARVLAGDGSDPLTHATGGSVDGDFHGPDWRSRDGHSMSLANASY